MLKTSIEIIKEHRKEGKSPDSELLDFALTILEEQKTKEIMEANKKIQEGISYLSKNNNWADLGSIAAHAIEEKVTTMEKDDRISKTHIEIVKFKKYILYMGKSEIIPLLTEEAREKYFKKTKK